MCKWDNAGTCRMQGRRCVVSGRNKHNSKWQWQSGKQVNQKVVMGLDQVASLNCSNFSVSSHLCPCLYSAGKTIFLLLQLFWSKFFLFFFSKHCGGIRCKRDWGRWWGRWEVELRGVMDERERWEETRRPLSVLSSSSSYCSDREYYALVDASQFVSVTAGEASGGVAMFLLT